MDESQIALIISVISITANIWVAIYSGALSEILASSDHKAKEQVKADTAKLLSTLRSIMHKGIFSITTGKEVDIEHERKSILHFINSQTGFAYQSWVEEKSKIAKKTGKKSEPWRTFFLDLSQIVSTESMYDSTMHAVEIEILFDNMTEKDVRKITNYNSNLIKAISNISKNRSENIVINALFEMKKKRNKENNEDVFFAKLKFLKTKGIKDPNIDMFIAVITGDINLLNNALDSGADQRVSSGEILRKYKKELMEFV